MHTGACAPDHVAPCLICYRGALAYASVNVYMYTHLLMLGENCLSAWPAAWCSDCERLRVMCCISSTVHVSLPAVPAAAFSSIQNTAHQIHVQITHSRRLQRGERAAAAAVTVAVAAAIVIAIAAAVVPGASGRRVARVRLAGVQNTRRPCVHICKISANANAHMLAERRAQQNRCICGMLQGHACANRSRSSAHTLLTTMLYL
jgi:hypothetical protein